MSQRFESCDFKCELQRLQRLWCPMVRIKSYAWLLPAAEFHTLDHDSLPTACICPTSTAALAAALVAISTVVIRAP